MDATILKQWYEIFEAASAGSFFFEAKPSKKEVLNHLGRLVVGSLDEEPDDEDNEEWSTEKYDAARKLIAIEYDNVMPIIAGSELSECDIGGNDVIDFIHRSAAVAKEGYEIYTWYGSSGEALVIGLKE